MIVHALMIRISLCLLLIGTATCVVLNLTMHIECPPELGFNTPLEGNTDASQELLDYCKSIPRCKDLYGQRNGDKLTLFEAVVQTTTEFSPPLYLETPIMLYICSSKPTLLELNALLWGIELERDYLGASQACSLDQEPGKAIIDPDGEATSFTCRPCPGCDVQTEDELNPLYIVFASMILFILAIFAAIQIWKLSVEERKIRSKSLHFDDGTGIIVQNPQI